MNRGWVVGVDRSLGVAWPWGGDRWLLGVVGRGFRLLGVGVVGCVIGWL